MQKKRMSLHPLVPNALRLSSFIPAGLRDFEYGAIEFAGFEQKASLLLIFWDPMKT